MSREKIAAAIREQAELKSKAEAENAVEAIIKAISEALVRGEKVELRDFGTFAVKGRAARKGRDLKTGATIDIPATKAIVFTPGGALREPVKAGKAAVGVVAVGKVAGEVKDKTAQAAKSCKKAVESCIKEVDVLLDRSGLKAKAESCLKGLEKQFVELSASMERLGVKDKAASCLKAMEGQLNELKAAIDRMELGAKAEGALKAAQAQLKDFGAKLEVWGVKAKAEAVASEARKYSQAAADKFSATCPELSKKIKDLSAPCGAALSELGAGFGKALGELKVSFQKAVQQFGGEKKV